MANQSNTKKMFQMQDRNFTRRSSRLSTVLKSFVLAIFAEAAGRAMEGFSLFSLCLSCKELLWTRGGVMKGALGGAGEGGGGELHCYLFFCPCCSISPYKDTSGRSECASPEQIQKTRAAERVSTSSSLRPCNGS